jgi:hypothetical protein
MSRIDPITAVYEVSDAMLEETGLRRDALAGAPWRCDDIDTILIPFGDLRIKAARPLNPTRLRWPLGEIAAGRALRPVPVFCEETVAVVLDGAHRIAVARALGCHSVPCVAVSLDEARDFYGYPEGQR